MAESRGVILDLGNLWTTGQVRVNGDDLGVLWKPPYQLDVTSALRAGVNQLEARLIHLQSQLEKTAIVSPIEGIVTQVNKGNTIIDIARTDTVKVKIRVPEKEISAIAMNNPVRLKVRSYPGLTYSGIVVKIDPLTLVDDRGRSIIEVTAWIDNHEGLLKPGMTGKAKINCGKKPIYKLVLWRVIRYLRIEFWSLW